METVRLPNFIIAGAPRSGTTWLYELLARHPQIYMAQPVKPEPKFFLVNELYEKGLNYYAKWFDGAMSGQLSGEKSTNYLESPVAARRIRHDLPHAKLVFILRDPVERAYSNYLWTRMNGLETEQFTTALSLEAKRESDLAPSLRYARPFSYFSRGLYADLLQPYFELFPRNQIHVLRFEDIRDNPTGLATELARFLGIEPRPRDALAVAAVNAAEKDDAGMPAEARRRLTAAYLGPNRRLAEMLGHGFRIWEPIVDV